MPRTLTPGLAEVVDETSPFGREPMANVGPARRIERDATQTQSRRFTDDLLGLATDDGGDLDSRSQPP